MPELFIPSGTGECDFTEKKSRFIGRAEKVDSAEKARDIVKQLKEKHPRARHVVWAYVIGKDASLKGLSDDGEPRGTGGRPVLDHIYGSKLTNTLVTVVRYFGGIKLGTGPLASAYGRAAEKALENMPEIRLIESRKLIINASFSYFSLLERFFKEKEIEVLKKEFDPEPVIYVNVPLLIMDEFISGVTDISHGKVVIERR